MALGEQTDSSEAGGASADALRRAYADIRADESLQFERTGFIPPEIPAWLSWISDGLRAMAPVFEVLFWIGLALIVAALAYVIIREILKLRLPPAKAKSPLAAPEPVWHPDESVARSLLAAVDALAAEGRFAEAAHLLLLRSVEDIELRRPRALAVSLTSREIARFEGLPDSARPAFTSIAQIVERSLFGGRAIDAADFSECRRAYEEFALPGGWRR